MSTGRSETLPNRVRSGLEAVRARLERACAAAGRDSASIRLVAVTKSVGVGEAAALVRLGQWDLGESRVGELERKALALEREGLSPRWHLVGHLQRNKARRALRLFAEIHSVDSLRLLEQLQRIAAEEDRSAGVWLEVDFTGSTERSGFTPGEVPAAAGAARAMERLELLGLMTIAPAPGAGAEGGTGEARDTFRRLRELRDSLPPGAFAGGRGRLSMGMSSDLEEAVLEGADVVRAGSALFSGLEGPEAKAEVRP